MNTEIKGYAPGLALPVSGVSDFWIWLDSCFGSWFPCLRLLDRLSDQLVDGFAPNVYTYEKGCHAIIKMVQRNDTSVHDEMITPRERLFGSAKKKTAARSETHAGTQLADMNKIATFY